MGVLAAPIVVGMLAAYGFAMQDDLRGVVALGFQEQRIHIRFAGHTSSLGLNSLRTTYLQAIGGGIRVERHVLRLEGGRLIAVLTEYPAECSSQNALAYIAACAHEHHGM